MRQTVDELDRQALSAEFHITSVLTLCDSNALERGVFSTGVRFRLSASQKVLAFFCVSAGDVFALRGLAAVARTNRDASFTALMPATSPPRTAQHNQSVISQASERPRRRSGPGVALSTARVPLDS